MQIWANKYPTSSDVERVFSPANWAYTAQNPERAFCAACPTLLQYGMMFGTSAPTKWIHAQILALFGASSSADRGMADGIPIFAASFAREAGAYKLTELMLFFARYKAGRYDNSYHTFDTRRIGNAFFKEFLPARQIELDRIAKQEEQRKIEERSFTPPEGYSSWTWYQHLKERAAKGDPEAIKQLK